jgi:anti-sigma regulatory factor (Ser/Thr protein kinase)
MVEVGTVDYSTLSGKMGWRSVAMDLKSVSTVGVKNGYIRPYFYAEGLSTSVMIDNIKIYDAIANNLAADIDAPAHVQSGKAAQLNVKVTNLGTAKASGYKVHLFIDGKKFETEEGEDLEPNAVATYEFAYTPKLHVGKFTVRGEVEWAADMFQDNNKSIDYTVEVVSSPLPAISDLAATDKGVLTWSAMDVDGVKVTDDFESYTPWSIARVGDWTLYDVLDVADAEHGNYRVEKGRFAVNEMCRNAMLMADMRRHANVNMYFTSDVADDYFIESDSRRIQQVLVNFLTNACKHTVQGEIHLHLSTTENPGRLTFSVTDTGTGIPPEMAKDIFERYKKLDGNVQGSGLGLHICSIIADRLGAEVKLDQTYTKGARFLFIL